jgi:hypothetical protein
LPGDKRKGYVNIPAAKFVGLYIRRVVLLLLLQVIIHGIYTVSDDDNG